MLPKETPRTVVNKKLKELYYEQKAETHQPLHSHTLSGVRYDIRTVDGKGDEISFTFQSKNKYALYPFNLIGDDSGEQEFKLQNKFPTFTVEDAPASCQDERRRQTSGAAAAVLLSERLAAARF